MDSLSATFHPTLDRTAPMSEAQRNWWIAGMALLSTRVIQGFIYWGGGSRRFIYAPQKIDPNAPTWMANKFQTAMPGALLGMDHVISFMLQHFWLLYAGVILFSAAELVMGAMLMGREAARHFVKRNHGNIVNIASTAALRGAAKGTAYYSSKFALRGMTECWRAELRQYNVRVFLVNPSEVLTNFYPTAGLSQKENETKLRSEDIANVAKCLLEMEDRAFAPETSLFATNPKD